MRVALLGGSGFIGSHAARRLQLAGDDVGLLHRGQRSVPAGCRSLIVDRNDPDALRATLSAFAPDRLIDMIAYTATDAERLLAVLPASVTRVVLISSGDVYASYGAFLGHEPFPTTLGAVPETGPLRAQLYPYRAQATSPTDFRYHYDKILVEQRFRTLCPIPLTVVRLPMVYGPGDPHQRVAAEVTRLRQNPGLLSLHPEEAGWRCTRSYVEDVAAAIVLATTHPRAVGQTYNVGEPDALTQRQWLLAIGQALGWRGNIVEDLAAQPSLPARWAVSLVASTDRIRAELGYAEPIGRADGLRQTVVAAAA